MVSHTAGLVAEVAQRHLDAAYTLGRWLLGNEQDAADAVHDAFVRASHSADTYAGGNARAWWLTIVRNCCLARLALRRKEQRNVAIDQVASDHGQERADALFDRIDHDGVEKQAEQREHRALIAHHLQNLSAEFREVLLLREIEELSYRDIADVLQVPIGTVMSRLARARALMQQALRPTRPGEVSDGL
jgi:RNA polymerase sigma-70 factor (ECF subfamily)